MQEQKPFTVAAVQAAPVFMDLEASLVKACDLIADAGREGAKLVVFPETFLPAYPEWVWVVPAGKSQMLDELYAELVENAVDIPSEITERLSQAARQANTHVVMGLNERNLEASGASLYNTLLTIDASGRILGKRRKLMPTAGERLVWAQGDGSTLEVYDTSLGKLGGLICWENYMPLARQALYAWGTQILAAPTWDRGDLWVATLRHIAKEGGVYVIGCCQALHVRDIPERFEFGQLYAEDKEWINTGGSCIVCPGGNIVAGPLHEQEGIIYAEIDLRRTRAAKRMLDVAGHYARPDVFRFEVNRSPNPIVRTTGLETEPEQPQTNSDPDKVAGTD